MRATGPWNLDWPVFWAEKVSVLLLAAHLEGQGWQPLLSVPKAERFGDPDGRGLDWALVIKTALRLRRPLDRGDHAKRRAAYQATSRPTEAERAVLRRDLRATLLGLVTAEKAYRYDGIWHDGGGNIDLRAYRHGQEELAVEAKGAIARGTRISWSHARDDVISVLPGSPLHGGHAPTNALLLPDDRRVAPPGKGFVRTLVDRAEGLNTWRIYLVDQDGGIAERRVSQLRQP